MHDSRHQEVKRIWIMFLAVSKNVFKIYRYKRHSGANYFNKADLQDNKRTIHFINQNKTMKYVYSMIKMTVNKKKMLVNTDEKFRRAGREAADNVPLWYQWEWMNEWNTLF